METPTGLINGKWLTQEVSRPPSPDSGAAGDCAKIKSKNETMFRSQAVPPWRSACHTKSLSVTRRAAREGGGRGLVDEPAEPACSVSDYFGGLAQKYRFTS